MRRDGRQERARRNAEHDLGGQPCHQPPAYRVGNAQQEAEQAREEQEAGLVLGRGVRVALRSLAVVSCALETRVTVVVAAQRQRSRGRRATNPTRYAASTSSTNVQIARNPYSTGWPTCKERQHRARQQDRAGGRAEPARRRGRPSARAAASIASKCAMNSSSRQAQAAGRARLVKSTDLDKLVVGNADHPVEC